MDNTIDISVLPKAERDRIRKMLGDSKITPHKHRDPININVEEDKVYWTAFVGDVMSRSTHPTHIAQLETEHKTSSSSIIATREGLSAQVKHQGLGKPITVGGWGEFTQRVLSSGKHMTELDVMGVLPHFLATCRSPVKDFVESNSDPSKSHKDIAAPICNKPHNKMTAGGAMQLYTNIPPSKTALTFPFKSTNARYKGGDQVKKEVDRLVFEHGDAFSKVVDAVFKEQNKAPPGYAEEAAEMSRITGKRPEPYLCPRRKYMITKLDYDHKNTKHPYPKDAGIMVLHSAGSDKQQQPIDPNPIAHKYDGIQGDISSAFIESDLEEPLSLMQHTRFNADPDFDSTNSSHIIHNYAKIDWSALLKFVDSQRRSLFIECSFPTHNHISFNTSWDLMFATFFIPLVYRGVISVRSDDGAFLNLIGQDGKPDPDAIAVFDAHLEKLSNEGAIAKSQESDLKEHQKLIDDNKTELLTLTAVSDSDQRQKLDAENKSSMEAIDVINSNIATQQREHEESAPFFRVSVKGIKTFIEIARFEFDLSGLHTFDDTALIIKPTARSTPARGDSWHIGIVWEVAAICQCRYAIPDNMRASKGSSERKSLRRNNADYCNRRQCANSRPHTAARCWFNDCTKVACRSMPDHTVKACTNGKTRASRRSERKKSKFKLPPRGALK